MNELTATCQRIIRQSSSDKLREDRRRYRQYRDVIGLIDSELARRQTKIAQDTIDIVNAMLTRRILIAA